MAAQCRGLSCEIEASVPATTKCHLNPEIAWHHDQYPRDIIKPVAWFEMTWMVCILLIVERNEIKKDMCYGIELTPNIDKLQLSTDTCISLVKEWFSFVWWYLVFAFSWFCIIFHNFYHYNYHLPGLYVLLLFFCQFGIKPKPATNYFHNIMFDLTVLYNFY